MQHLYFSELQKILKGLMTLELVRSSTPDSLKLIQKVQEMVKEEEDRMNRD